MSRYIDVKFILNETDEFGYENGVLYGLSGNSAPSIDIVRCKECKWARPTATSEDIYCEPFKHYRYADGFCSYGEREGE